jgi:pyruvate dehydrogenase E2 component (dihydrolipoamide acetyltransferase)
MPTLVKMPKWGLTMTVGTVTDWLHQEGDEISAGDPLLTVETEKAVNDVEAPADGILRKIVAVSGEEVPVSGPIGIITAPGEDLSDDDLTALIATATPQATYQAAEPGGRAVREAGTAVRDDSGRVNASPAARKRAKELGVDLSTADATGPGGRITSDDVERAASALSEDPSPRTEFVDAYGLRLFQLVAGPAKAQRLVFLHGLSGSQSTWQVVLGDLANRYRVAAFDLPGHGQSDKPDQASTDYGVSSQASTVAAALKSSDLAPAIVIGHSLGGAIALRIALDHPDMVQGLVLVNSAGLGSDVNPALPVLMERKPGPDTARAMLQLFFADQSWVLDRGVNEMAHGQLAEGGWAAQRATASAAFSEDRQTIDITDRLADVSAPTLIVWGAKDRVFPVDHAVTAAGIMPDATLRLLPNIGHVPQVEAASELARAIDRFARSLAE